MLGAQQPMKVVVGPSPKAAAEGADGVEPEIDYDSPSSILAAAGNSALCRKMQKDLEQNSSRAFGEKVVKAFEGHAVESARHPWRNFVLQKVIAAVRPEACEGILAELLAEALPVAKHRYGCRVVQRVLEYCTERQVACLVSRLLDHALALCEHAFGNFVVQHLLDHGSREHQARLVRELLGDVVRAGTGSHSTGVLAKALCDGAAEHQLELARAVLGSRDYSAEGCPFLIAQMSKHRHGHLAVQHMLRALPRELREEAQRQLWESREALRSARYGKLVLKQLRTT